MAFNQETQSCTDQGLYIVIRDMSAQLAVDRLMIQQLQKVNEEQAVKLKELEKQNSEVDSLKKLLHEQESVLQDLVTKTVRRNKEVEQVAFSASLRSANVTLGPYSTHTTLAFTHVVTNIGDAYNPSTGVFTAPVRGAYHFEFYVCGQGKKAAVLVKNEEHTFAVCEHGSPCSTGANGVTLLLEVGDVVFIRLWEQHTIFDNENHHSTFSGHLLFTM